MDKKLTITLKVAGQKLKMIVDPAREKFFRQAEEEIEKTLLTYQARNKGMTIESAMRYALVSSVAAIYEYEDAGKTIESDCDDLNSRLDNVLTKHS